LVSQSGPVEKIGSPESATCGGGTGKKIAITRLANQQHDDDDRPGILRLCGAPRARFLTAPTILLNMARTAPLAQVSRITTRSEDLGTGVRLHIAGFPVVFCCRIPGYRLRGNGFN
jgi:hypothetical protein